MSSLHRLVIVTSITLVAARNANAIALPDTGSTPCNTTGPCLKIQQNGTGGNSEAIFGYNLNGGVAVVGTSTGGYGIEGNSTTSGIGVHGTSSSFYGIKGESVTSVGVYGISTAGNTTANGVEGHSAYGNGVYGVSTGGWPSAGVYGTNSSTGAGVYGVASNSSGVGVAGIADLSNGTGGFFQSLGASGKGVYGYATSSTGYAVYGQNTTSGGYAVYANGDLGVTGTPWANQSTFMTFSDVRLKKNVQPLEGALTRLLQLRGVTYEWKEPIKQGNQFGIQRGFIAQDVEKVLPEWVSTDTDGLKHINIPGRGLEAMLVESIRELKIQNDALRERVQTLEQGRPPMAAGLTKGMGAVIGLGFLPIGIVVATLQRKRRNQS